MIAGGFSACFFIFPSGARKTDAAHLGGILYILHHGSRFASSNNGESKKRIDAYFKSLAQFMDNAQLHGWIGTVDDIGHSGTGQTAFGRKLILGHILFGKEFHQPYTDCPIKLHTITNMTNNS